MTLRDKELQEGGMFEYLWNIIQRHMAETLEHVGKKWTLGVSGKKALRQKEATNNYDTGQFSKRKEVGF